MWINYKNITLLLSVILCLHVISTHAEESDLSAGVVYYVSGSELEAFNEGIFMAAGPDGYYTSLDGEEWVKRADGNFGGIAPDNANNTRQGIAYGGLSGKKTALITSGDVSSALYYTDEALNYCGAADSIDADSGEYLYVNTILWDDFTKKFWCAANAVNGASVSDTAGIYYGTGIPENNIFMWNRVPLGEGDLYSEVPASEGVYARYWYLNTNGAGVFVYSAANVTRVGRARYCVGILSTDENMSSFNGKKYSLSDRAQILGDSTPYVLETGEVSNSSGSQEAWDVKYADVDAAGRLLVAPGSMKTGVWHRMITRNIYDEDSSWYWGPIAKGTYQGFNYVYILWNSTDVVAIPKGPARTGSLRDKASVDILRIPYSLDDGFSDGSLVLKNEETEVEFFGTSETICLTSACMKDDKLIVALYSSSSGTYRVGTVNMSTGKLEYAVVPDSSITNIKIKTNELNPKEENGMRLIAESTSENKGQIVWEKTDGSSGVDVSADGEVTISAENNSRTVRIKVKAYLKSNPSVYTMSEFRFNYITASAVLSFTYDEEEMAQPKDGATAVVDVTYNNPTARDKSMYIILCLYDGRRCIDSVVWHEIVEASADGVSGRYSYLLNIEDYTDIEAKIFVIDGDTMRDIQEDSL